MTRGVLAATAILLAAAPAAAQTIPEGAQAAKVQPGYRRTPTFRNDPFRHAMIPHWGLVFSAGGSAENNAIRAADARAVYYLADRDSLLPGDLINLLGLIPRGAGLSALVQGEGGVHLGGSFGSTFSIGLSARARGYGSFLLDDSFLALLRDGNGARQDFSLGRSQGAALGTGEAGAHGVFRFGPLGSPDGVKLALGFGLRYIRPVFFAQIHSTLANGGTLRITGDSISANIQLEQLLTRDPEETFRQSSASFATDLLFRLEWPTSGLALEALVANIGKVNIPLVERSDFAVNVATTSLTTVQDSLDRTPGVDDDFEFRQFAVRDTNTISLTLPRVVRFTASAWANRILQIDLGATMPVTGDFETPLAVDIGTTWRFIRTLPLRAGVMLGGAQGIGYSAGLAIEARTMYLQIAAQSLGGFVSNATGAGVRLEWGLFF